jgi:hypothetical protein
MDRHPETTEPAQRRQFTLRQLFKVVTALAVFFALPSGAWLLGLLTWGFLLPATVALAGLMLLQFPLLWLVQPSRAGLALPESNRSQAATCGRASPALWLVQRYVLPPDPAIIAEQVAAGSEIRDQRESPASPNRSPG